MNHSTKIEHWVIYEASLSGHHQTYLLELVKILSIRANAKITVALSLPTSDKIDENALRDSMPGVTLHIFTRTNPESFGSGALGLVKREFYYWQDINNIVNAISAKTPVTHIFLPYMDYCLYAMGLLGSPGSNQQVSGVVMRPSFHHRHVGVLGPSSKLDRIKQLVFDLFIRRSGVQAVFTIDPTFTSFLSKKPISVQNKVIELPDPAKFTGQMTRSEARTLLQIKPTMRIVLVYGAIDDRKGMKQLLDTLASTEALSDIGVLIVGKCSASALQLLKSDASQRLVADARLKVLNYRVSDEEEQMAFACSDAVWLGYEGHLSMSGVLIKAIIGDRWILATQLGLIGWYAKRQDKGLLFDINDKSQILTALEKITHAPEFLQSTLTDQFSWQHAHKVVTLALDRAIN